jgi:DNA-binding transcriptional regulator GbsR (MarR family)
METINVKQIKERGIKRTLFVDENNEVQSITFASRNFHIEVSDLNLKIHIEPDDPETPYFLTSEEEAKKVSITAVLNYFKDVLKYELEKARQRED